ncbi:translation initiation factor IF-2-like [Canis lupus dingo]|uniref:translation initiation factor IF-2-like n=1 Tax=Canis lupus dingo TaxID=286419 RepID=UPI0020C33CE2|nr:translation initiation factor IF-2-like [Canis lupus dingo]
MTGQSEVQSNASIIQIDTINEHGDGFGGQETVLKLTCSDGCIPREYTENHRTLSPLRSRPESPEDTQERQTPGGAERGERPPAPGRRSPGGPASGGSAGRSRGGRKRSRNIASRRHKTRTRHLHRGLRRFKANSPRGAALRRGLRVWRRPAGPRARLPAQPRAAARPSLPARGPEPPERRDPAPPSAPQNKSGRRRRRRRPRAPGLGAPGLGARGPAEASEGPRAAGPHTYRRAQSPARASGEDAPASRAPEFKSARAASGGGSSGEAPAPPAAGPRPRPWAAARRPAAPGS